MKLKSFLRDNDIMFCGIIETQLRKKFVNRVCDTVFYSWKWCSNSVDSPKGCRIAVGWDQGKCAAHLISQTSQVMHFLVRCLSNNSQVYVSIVYGENSPKTRLGLWKNLLEHKMGVGNESWVLLGDFNIILNINENTNGVNIRCKGMKEFRECVENLEVEDINMCGLFYTWIQRISNPKLGILKKLDRVMGNSQFISVYPASYANFMPYLSSDHYLAVLIIPNVVRSKPRSFRFMNFLADKSDFLKVVKDNWYIDIEGYNMFKLVKRLKALK
ncbi:ribonuclease H-like domain-containing protein, partial [Tanacetum coccineum]